MGCATSKLTASGSRNKNGERHLAENKQNNHIIKDEKLEKFTGVDEQRKSKDSTSASASAADPSTTTNRLRSGSSDRRSIRNSAREARRLDDGGDAERIIFKPPSALVGSSGPPGSKDSAIRIVTLKASIDKKPTSLDEKSSAVLKYRTPHFRASAVVEIPDLADDKAIKIGWIQTCSRMRFINTYGKEGVTSWEFPEIVSGKYEMISDADGKQYPWYGSRHEIQTVRGPCSRQTVAVHMNDNFFPQVTWYVPHPTYDRSPRLTSIHREQHFYTYLVVHDLSSGVYHVLKTITWSMTINVAVDPDCPLGRRARLLEPFEQRPPAILDDGGGDGGAPSAADNGGAPARHRRPVARPEVYAMRPPNANSAQVLVWRPLVGEPRIVVPAEETTVSLEKYLQTTRDYLRHSEYQLRET